MTPLEHAIELGEQGYTCFPCREDKRPFPGSRGFLDGSTDAGDLAALWAKYPGPLVGVATGMASRIAVLDLDKKHTPASQWYTQQKAKLLPTRAHRTRSGGIHLLYGLDDDELKNSASKLCRGIDVRGNGGYIIWWPAAGCPVLSEAPCAPWPEFLNPPPPEIRRTEYRPMRSNTSARGIEDRVRGLLKFACDAPVGERNARVYWAACKIRDMIVARELEPCEGDDAFEELRKIGAHVGLHDTEIMRTIRSAALGSAA